MSDMPLPTPPAAEHLGDGAYVQALHGAVWVTANHHDIDPATDIVSISGLREVERLEAWLHRWRAWHEAVCTELARRREAQGAGR